MSINEQIRVRDSGATVLALRESAKPDPQVSAPTEAKGPAPGSDLDKLLSVAAAPAAEQRGDNRRSYRKRLMLACGAVLFGAILAAGYVYWDYAKRFESTDDAFIDARQFIVAPKVAGYITQVSVTDNQHVAAGDVIARIDDRDYRNALEQAEGQVAAAAASIQNIDAQITIQRSQIAASRAQVDQTQAALTFAQQQAARYQDLAASSAGTLQMAQETASQLSQGQASLRNAQAVLVAAQHQIESLQAQRSVGEANLTQATAQRDEARLNLAYTTITAEQAGRVVNLTGSVGEYAQAGTGISNFVPDDIWVVANFKETQLTDMRPGQPATIHIDAYPDHRVVGHVDSVQPGSGTVFSLLPAQNATGNFVKIVQRVPVKISLKNPPQDVALGPGMSVEPTVRVQAAPSLYERLKSWL